MTNFMFSSLNWCFAPLVHFVVARKPRMDVRSLVGKQVWVYCIGHPVFQRAGKAMFFAITFKDFVSLIRLPIIRFQNEKNKTCAFLYRAIFQNFGICNGKWNICTKEKEFGVNLTVTFVPLLQLIRKTVGRTLMVKELDNSPKGHSLFDCLLFLTF